MKKKKIQNKMVLMITRYIVYKATSTFSWVVGVVT